MKQPTDFWEDKSFLLMVGTGFLTESPNFGIFMIDGDQLTDAEKELIKSKLDRM